MANAYASMHGRSLASMLDVGVTGQWTVCALRGLSSGPTGRRSPSFGTCRPAPCDLDFIRGDLATIAHREVYGH